MGRLPLQLSAKLSRGSFLVATALAFSAIAIAVGCSDAKPRPAVPGDAGDADASPAPSIDAGPDAACSVPGSFGSSSCNACAGQTCCAPLAACTGDDGCRAFLDCFFPCLDVPDSGGCVKACEAAHPDDQGLWYNLSGCVYFNPPCEVHCSTTR